MSKHLLCYCKTYVLHIKHAQTSHKEFWDIIPTINAQLQSHPATVLQCGLFQVELVPLIVIFIPVNAFGSRALSPAAVFLSELFVKGGLLATKLMSCDQVLAIFRGRGPCYQLRVTRQGPQVNVQGALSPHGSRVFRVERRFCRRHMQFKYLAFGACR